MTKAANDGLPTAILISGRGSNMKAILDAVAAGTLNLDIRAVISDRPGAAGLDTAREMGINAIALDYRAADSREDFDAQLVEAVDNSGARLVVLAGFMRILTPAFVQHYRGRLLNIHPSLLPLHPGLNTHQRVLDAGHTQHGVTVHFVTEELDGGPLIAHARVAVKKGDTEEQLAARVLQKEHLLYPEVLRWYAAGRLKLDGHYAVVDGEIVERPLEPDL